MIPQCPAIERVPQQLRRFAEIPQWCAFSRFSPKGYCHRGTLEQAVASAGNCNTLIGFEAKPTDSFATIRLTLADHASVGDELEGFAAFVLAAFPTFACRGRDDQIQLIGLVDTFGPITNYKFRHGNVVGYVQSRQHEFIYASLDRKLSAAPRDVLNVTAQLLRFLFTVPTSFNGL